MNLQSNFDLRVAEDVTVREINAQVRSRDPHARAVA